VDGKMPPICFVLKHVKTDKIFFSGKKFYKEKYIFAKKYIYKKKIFKIFFALVD
jgi:hypothetical protein